MKKILFGALLASTLAFADPTLGVISGFELHWEDADTIEIHDGVYIYPGGVGTAKLEEEITISMPADLDTGSELPNQWYAVYIYQDNDTGVVGGILSTNGASPFGQQNSVRVGWAYNDANNDMRKFMQSQTSNSRMTCYHIPTNIVVALEDGSATSWSSVTFGTLIPPTANIACLEMSFKSTMSGTGSDGGYLRMSTDGVPSCFTSGVQSDNPATFHQMLRLGADRTLNYRVDSTNNRFNIKVLGYIDQL